LSGQTFDATGQTVSSSNALGEITTHTYDPVGNRLVKNEAGSRTTYTYDAANQLQTALALTGSTTFAFDQAGNQQIEKAPTGTTTNTWNYENQLAGVVLPSGQRVTMAYNADFRRTYNGE